MLPETEEDATGFVVCIFDAAGRGKTAGSGIWLRVASSKQSASNESSSYSSATW